MEEPAIGVEKTHWKERVGLEFGTAFVGKYNRDLV